MKVRLREIVFVAISICLGSCSYNPFQYHPLETNTAEAYSDLSQLPPGPPVKLKSRIGGLAKPKPQHLTRSQFIPYLPEEMEAVPPKPSSLPDWTCPADKRISQDFIFHEDIYDIRMLVPKDLKFMYRRMSSGLMFLGRTPERKDKSAAIFMATFLRVHRKQKKPLSLQEGLQHAVASIRRGRKKNWQCSIPQWGLINGKEYLRAHWSGETPDHEMASGTVYATTEGESLAVFSAQDLTKHKASYLDNLEGAIRTAKFMAKTKGS